MSVARAPRGAGSANSMASATALVVMRRARVDWDVSMVPSGHRLPGGEVRLALLDVGAQAFLGVVALEQLLLQLALDRQRRLERDLDAALHRALDAAHRLRGAVRRAEALGVLLDLLHELVGARGLPDLVDDAELLRALEVERLARHHELDRGRLVDEPGQPLGAAGAREHAQRDLGEPDLARTLARDAEIGRHRDLEPAAHGVPVERRDHELGGLLEAVEGLVRMEAEVVLEDRIDRLQHVDVGARAEELLARAT